MPERSQTQTRLPISGLVFVLDFVRDERAILRTGRARPRPTEKVICLPWGSAAPRA
jgi:hypothetical protein